MTGDDRKRQEATRVLHLLHDLQGRQLAFMATRHSSRNATLVAPTRSAMPISFATRLLIATILRRQNEFLMEVIAFQTAQLEFYKQVVPRPRKHLSIAWRRRFAELGAAVGWNRLAEFGTVATAKTIRAWHRQLLSGKMVLASRKIGRPRTRPEIEALVLRMAQENAGWGQIRMVGELRGLGIRIAPRTVAAILKRHGISPTPTRERDRHWKLFLTKQANEICATDFFTWDVGGWFGKTTMYVLFAIHLATRQVRILGVTDHPHERFMVQTAKNETTEDGIFTRVGARYLIHDRDTKFSAAWKHVLSEASVEPAATPPRSPYLNGFAERWVRTVKRECLRKVRIKTEADLRQALSEFVRHYHAERPHQGMGNRPPDQGPGPESAAGSGTWATCAESRGW